jgi:hypothetical protein
VIEVNVPNGGSTTIVDQTGRAFHARVHEGRVVIDLLPREFRALLSGRQGKAWHDANPEALRRLAEIA